MTYSFIFKTETLSISLTDGEWKIEIYPEGSTVLSNKDIKNIIKFLQINT